ncbi:MULTISPECIES: 23S rRNA (pseudouridine(1915)-N(3))-methyltransferase RlmH [Methylosinus]|uniref:Ribosomal RNA large subunit methyltransferase H n=1 Tax=Methylosinus trichosporium (strain ATCC 35070 / NCIMB 11131 / UNIQEM 75 / OB3b) TaxID=595536 RepID=A0A2D2D3N3_METT3|nr:MULTISPECIES: 23S rRNA (pseudouridine(1915)-N(3))-methyltransferase RlmH [Methylosinus]ATQ69603.1 23S rRNA (pseudouridine(1915)-N(3))-methyltransferase RlmH [Methylosinus trichosporium OB3b]OBS52027.1 23S rRNA (pseudouridine(1915)-N(3))-methyltransferase RlmH [Methylosinus sp. 3S-1]
MRLGLLCVGRLKAGPEREIYARYASRIAALRNLGFAGLDLQEIDESKARTPAERMAQEGAALLAATPAGARLVVFDERGRAASSVDFARLLESERDRGVKALAFAIGGAEGLAPAARERAQAVFSFGAMTLPHQLVRILVAEQIYRAMTILSGHPYHRG